MTDELKDIAELFGSEESVALYRLPFSDEFTVVIQDGQKASSATDGFVMMPFAESETHPTVVISPDIILHCKYNTIFLFWQINRLHKSPYLGYVNFFANFLRINLNYRSFMPHFTWFRTTGRNAPDSSDGSPQAH